MKLPVPLPRAGGPNRAAPTKTPPAGKAQPELSPMLFEFYIIEDNLLIFS